MKIFMALLLILLVVGCSGTKILDDKTSNIPYEIEITGNDDKIETIKAFSHKWDRNFWSDKVMRLIVYKIDSTKIIIPMVYIKKVKIQGDK